MALFLWTPERQRLRSVDLLADFASGYAAGWHMLVPEAFREALGIKLTSRVKGNIPAGVEILGPDPDDKRKLDDENDRRHLIWTQGYGFSFAENDMIYKIDSALCGPCHNSKWADFSKFVEFAIRIERAEPVQLGNEAEIKDRGFVYFEVLRLSGPRLIKQEPRVLVTTDQVDFVHFLRTGQHCWGDKILAEKSLCSVGGLGQVLH